MVTFDDMSANEKVRLYDKGVDRLDEIDHANRRNCHTQDRWH